MTLSLTQAQFQDIEDKLFLFKTLPPALPIPKNTDDGTLPTDFFARMMPVATNSRFKDISFGVVDFTADRFNPRIFLHNADIAWRMGSTGKIAALLAAAQLRDDATGVMETGHVKPEDFDELFATIWKRSRLRHIREIAGKDGAPRVSTIINLKDTTKRPLDFLGAHVDLKKRDRLDLGPEPWKRMQEISIRDRLWLMGAQSDNVAATSCISEIGVAYMKEVQIAYGLWNYDERKGMHMMLAAGYWPSIPTMPVTKDPGAPKYRPLRKKDLESHEVVDKYFDGTNPKVTGQSGSVRALAAYMIALMQDKLVNQAGCDAIKSSLADELPSSNPGSLVKGVQDNPEGVNKAHAKGGALDPRFGAERALRCDVAYIESANKKYAIVAQGLVPLKDGADSFTAEQQGEDLAKAIHFFMKAP